MSLPQGSGGPPVPDIIIAGASTRSAAFSALRAGFRPCCLDRHADADLRAVAQVSKIGDYPNGIIAALEDWPEAPVMYVGALENAGNVLDFMEMGRPFAANPRDVVRRVRDPELVADTFQEFNLPYLEVCGMHVPPPRDGNWLVKPLAGAGGRGICPWTEDTPTPGEPHYFQQRAIGNSYSALFVAPADQRDVRFVGITRQLIGDSRLAVTPFAWCGSVGPETLGVEIEQVVRRIGNILSWKLGLAGLFGIDFVVDAAGVPRITEVNPRYTGSVEILEYTLRLPLIADHCSVFGIESPGDLVASAGATALGKFILYAKDEFIAPQPADWLLPEEWLHADIWRDVPKVADIPPGGTLIRPGEPICSLFVSGSSAVDCLEKLPQQLDSVLSRLGLPARAVLA